MAPVENSVQGSQMTSAVSSVEYFREIYSSRESAWGEAASDLAREAVALVKLHSADTPIRVLDIGCGDGRDSILFAKQGWSVTAVDNSAPALAALQHKAAEWGVADKIQVLNTNFAGLHLDTTYQLIFSNYSLHFLEHSARPAFFHTLKEHTAPGGLHAILVMRDMNEEFIGQLKDYRYFGTSELSNFYADWELLDNYDWMIPDQPYNAQPREHSVGILIARKPLSTPSQRRQRGQNFWPSLFVVMGITLLSIVLCTLGYPSLTARAGAIASVWPGAIFQGILSVAFGGWGVLAIIFGGMVTVAINAHSWWGVLSLIPANFLQALIPAYYYRRVLKKGGWNRRVLRFLPFALFAVVIPNIVGAAAGALAFHLHSGAPYAALFWKWIAANIPIALALGWPLFRYGVPSLVDEGWTIKGWWK